MTCFNSYYNETEIEGLCGMCDMWKGEVDEIGCLASHASVTTLEGDRTVRDLRVGDLVKSVTLDDVGVGVGVGVGDKVLGAGYVVWSRVIFLHDHTQRAATLELTVGEKAGVARRHLQMTAPHLVSVRQRQQGVDTHTHTHTTRCCLRAMSALVIWSTWRTGDSWGWRRFWMCRQGRASCAMW